VRKYLERRVLGVLEDKLKSGSAEERQVTMQKIQRDLPMWERQATIYKLYQRSHKSVMVRPRVRLGFERSILGLMCVCVCAVCSASQIVACVTPLRMRAFVRRW
jgi:hypothetical protein